MLTVTISYLLQGRTEHKKHIPRKPQENGLEMKMLSDTGGFMYNAVLVCDEPLKYDEHIGKIGALCHELFASMDNPDGANYLDENRTVKSSINVK